MPGAFVLFDTMCVPERPSKRSLLSPKTTMSKLLSWVWTTRARLVGWLLGIQPTASPAMRAVGCCSFATARRPAPTALLLGADEKPR